MPEPDRASRYLLGKEIARGGLGRVVEAFDTELKRPVAVKLILDEMPAEVRERFVREAELTARLEHPNIVPVHGLVGSAAGGDSQLQLAMKRIQGRDLETLVKALAAGDEETAKAWSRPRLLAMFQHICLGVAFAHDRGVIHRDLKPSNVMIGEYGETLIVDWGLAKEKKVEAVSAPPRAIQTSVEGWATRTLVPARDSSLLSISLTMDGDIVGTPAYMPPEQAEGRLADVDERSDIYALGAILYEILTFRPPVDGASLDELLTRVRSGAILPPSRHSLPDRTAAHIPLELDAIVMKALALRREDRYQDARALHDDIQLFLEGVKELEHRQKAARERVEAGRRWFSVYRELKSEIEAQKHRVKDLTEKIRPHQPPAEKRPLWEAEARHRALREERIDAFSRASAEFGQALTVDPANAEALDGKCDLFLDRFLEAERRRDREEMQLNRNTLAQYDGSGKYRAGLEAPGRLTIRASGYGCGCLGPVKVPGWRVEISGTPDIAWRDGGPQPGVALTPQDRPVPGVRTFPEGARWGHTKSCPRRELCGVEVWIAKYEERDKRLVLGPERQLGECPIQSVELEQGSYRCTLRPRDSAMAELYLPVLIERGSHWEQDVTVYRREEIPAGFRFIPGGPFTFGGTWAGGASEEQTLVTRDFFLSEFATTCGEYLEFLNALCDSGGLEEARRRQPREADKKWWIEESGRFRLPTAAESPKFPWNARWPVFAIDWFDAVAFATWKSGKDGIPYRLLHEEEYEKAARGVDGRGFSFGNDYDSSYSHTSASVEGGVTPLPVGAFPSDESPCGARDLSGGVTTWCWNAPNDPWRDWRATRGGAWSTNAIGARAAYRRIEAPTHLAWYYGVRLAVAARRD